MMPTMAPARPSAQRSLLARRRPATRLALLALGLVTSVTLPSPWLAIWFVLLWAAALQSGLTKADLIGAAKPWWPLALIVVAIHLLTTTAAAPLGHPSWAGAVAGVVALVRVAATMLCLWVFLRSGDLTELTAGLGWWLQPLGPVLGDPRRIGVVLAVALGAVPRALADARRIDAVVRLRRTAVTAGADPASQPTVAGTQPPLPVRWWRGLRDRGRLVVPLVEGIFRRADGLSLALAGRLPQPDLARARPTAGEAVGLVAWAVGGGMLWYFVKKYF